MPLALHGDGGRHYRKTEIMVFQFQSCLGLGSRQSTGQKPCKKRKLDRGSVALVERTSAQISMLGHSFETRFLIGTMARQYYAESTEPLIGFLRHISLFFGELYRTGVMHRGKLVKFLLVAVKGDLPFLAKVGGMERTFLHIRKRKKTRGSKPLSGCCWLCVAGSENILFEDFSKEAPWMAATGLDNPTPWQSQPTIFTDILHDELAQPNFFKIDLFHVLNLDQFNTSLSMSIFGALAPYK